MGEIGIGLVGGGYMGKAHAVAFSAVGAVFDTPLRPRLEMIAASTAESALRYAKAYGFCHATADWRELVADKNVEAVVIASPQDTHRAIAEAAFALGKPVFCEKPLGASLDDARAMTTAARSSGVANMIGFNYVRTPATQFARKLIAEGAIGEIVWFRGEHTEDFLANPALPSNWRTRDVSAGALGDLAPHMINCALAVAGPIVGLQCMAETVHPVRQGPAGSEEVRNDDQAQFMCRFASGAMGHLFFSRVATGRKMGYVYEVFGTKGSIRFDQEDQNAIWFYRAEGPEEERGFRKILAGPAHPDFLPFCQGPGHGTGYQDQIIIEARDFLHAIDSGKPVWPTFEDGLEVWKVVDAAFRSSAGRCWVEIAPVAS
ncbi:MAG: Gfo/Idh/MocA family oxidoreductase [Rhodobacteraceae bacterium]|nr:Gfo/Idh/MocA family oxidoreductase [Paracoccaceae bacterium]